MSVAEDDYTFEAATPTTVIAVIGGGIGIGGGHSEIKSNDVLSTIWWGRLTGEQNICCAKEESATP